MRALSVGKTVKKNQRRLNPRVPKRKRRNRDFLRFDPFFLILTDFFFWWGEGCLSLSQLLLTPRHGRLKSSTKKTFMSASSENVK